MGKLKFTNTDIKLEIEDEVFYVDIYDDKLIENVGKFEEIARKFNDDNGNLTYTDVKNAIIDIVKSILGEDSIERIFKGKDPKFGNLLELCIYITNEFNNQREEINKAFYVKK